MDVFVSVGSGLSPAQDAFISAVEARLRGLGLVPHTLERNEWSTLAPLAAVSELMSRCRGAVIVGLERYHFPEGVERRGSDRQRSTGPVSFATSWNQIEAALAYSHDLPLLVIVDEDLALDGLLEPGYDWYVARTPLNASALRTERFDGLLKSWCARIAAAEELASKSDESLALEDLSKVSIAKLAGALRPGQLWSILVVATVLLSGAFALGAKIGSKIDQPVAPGVTAKIK